MSVSIASFSVPYAVHSVADAQPAPQTNQTSSQPLTDTVHISEAAQVKLLEQQGESTETIAETLGLSTSTIDDFLNINDDSSFASASTASLVASSH